MMKKQKMLSLFLSFMVALGWVFFDQMTKAWAVNALKGKPAMVLIPDILEFSYLENRGMAFGLLENRQWLFAVFTVLFLLAAVYFFWKIPAKGRYLPLSLSLALLTGGTVGNFIDRIFQRYVVDFIYVSAIKFPVFNVADIGVTVSVIALGILILFVYREEELKILFSKKKAGTDSHDGE